MAKKQKKSLLGGSSFLLPWRIIREQHLSKKDVKNVKNNMLLSTSTVNLIVAIILFVLTNILHLFMTISTNNKLIETYGIASLIGQAVLVAGCIITIVFILIGRSPKKPAVSFKLLRTAGILLYLSISSFAFLCILADAKMGFTKQSETLSASVIFLAILILIRPTHWVDAFLLDLGTAFGIFGISLYCFVVYKMGAIQYYTLIALLFPVIAYLVLGLLFFAETQRYKQILENERLHNRAYYDHLTHCKNRHALSEFLKENKNRWENKDNANLLMVLFDIDNFKLYNDQFSHLGGDYCLRSICDAVREEFPSPSLDFFRYGGEEFLMFFELRNPEDAPLIMQKIRLAISKLDIVAPEGAPKKMVTISLGGLLINNVDQFEFENEMKTVDSYLYKAKANGKDVACFNGQIIN